MCSRFCFLEFEDAADAEKALDEIGKMEFPSGQHIIIRNAGVRKDLTSVKEEEPVRFRIQRTGRQNMNMDKLLNKDTNDDADASSEESS